MNDEKYILKENKRNETNLETEQSSRCFSSPPPILESQMNELVARVLISGVCPFWEGVLDFFFFDNGGIG